MKKLKMGVVNIMPNAQEYELLLREAFTDVLDLVELYPIRLKSHAYRSSSDDIRPYWTFEELTRYVSLDLLLITGAPVEHLPFSEIHYIQELNEILAAAANSVISIFGLCFGGLAIASHVGIAKRLQPSKIFGVYELTVSSGAERYVGRQCKSIQMPFSTWALLNSDALPQLGHASIVPLASHPDLGPVLLATQDDKFVMMLGHPEYSAATLRREWLRDSKKDIAYTKNFSEASFVEMERRLQSGTSSILANWVIHHFNSATLAA
jgi:homoserine O-succinyltransferase/O-acetyltransferase